MANRRFRGMIILCAALGLPLYAAAQSSSPAPTAAASGAPTGSTADATAQSLAELRAQVQALAEEVSELRAEGRQEHAEVRALREELEKANGTAPVAEQVAYTPAVASFRDEPVASAPVVAQPQEPSAPPASIDQRLDRLEEGQQLLDSKLASQYLSKVESASNYRVRLSGIVLLNLYENRGTVDNQDFPGIAEPADLLGSPGAFGGSLRQSQIGLQVFGPQIFGAQTSADVKFDFAGGFPDEPNGATMGIVRLRTGTIRLDWKNTSVVAGQDRLFFAPLAPTSLAVLAVPALSYAGNLWSWVPQVRVEHRIDLSDKSSLMLQGGILDSFSGDLPFSDYGRYPSWGEMSGQPAYAGRVAWSHRLFGQDATLGAGGYFGRQNWGLNRNINGWASTVDLTVPLGRYFGFTGAFYRGAAVAGLGGAIGQDVVWNGSFIAPTTAIRAVDSEGGWVQLKFKATSKLEFNAAVGDDNPFAGELRSASSPPAYFDTILSRNFSPFVNFIYQVRSDVLFSVEYRQLRTFTLDGGSATAHHINVSLGYTF